jgi:hypothetical protein
MKTYIEFFEKEASENICGSLIAPPDTVILIGDRKKLMEEHAERYKEVLQKKNKKIEFICKTVNKHNIDDIISLLSDIVKEYDDCVFDLTGGEDLFLVAMGIVCERYKQNNIYMHRINIRNGKIIECGQTDKTIEIDKNASLSVEDYIRIYGGKVISYETKPNGTFYWEMNDDFKEDILSLWDICKRDVGLWNTQINVFEALESIANCNNELLTSTANIELLEDYLETKGKKYICINWLVNALDDYGLARIKKTKSIFCVAYKNEQVKRCLTKAGQVLEMIVYLLSLEVKDKSGEYVYYDALNGVLIDWDGDIHYQDNYVDTENEVDVILMKGLVPVFISCKNGAVEMDELYKLHTVASRFGGAYAKKVLVATSLGKSEFSYYFRQRAKDLNIRLVENIQELSHNQLEKLVATFGNN